MRKAVRNRLFERKKMPMKCHENICVFYQKTPTYNPQFLGGEPYKRTTGSHSKNYGKQTAIKDREYAGKRFPRDVLKIQGDGADRGLHPTQKPVQLLEYLIKTYTNPGETVLDNCMGSGSTGVACINTGRKFIGIELDSGYFQAAKERIERASAQMRMDAAI